MCSHTAFTDGPNHHQGASSSRHSTPGFLKPRQPGLDSSPPAATKTQEPWFPDCLDFPKYFGSRPNCHSSTGLRIEPGISYPLPVFKINLSSKDKYSSFRSLGPNWLHFSLLKQGSRRLAMKHHISQYFPRFWWHLATF